MSVKNQQRHTNVLPDLEEAASVPEVCKPEGHKYLHDNRPHEGLGGGHRVLIARVYEASEVGLLDELGIHHVAYPHRLEAKLLVLLLHLQHIPRLA